MYRKTRWRRALYRRARCGTVAPMFIDTVPNRGSPPAILLRESWREGPRTIKRTLASAKSITFAQDGASRPYIEKMLDQLGIADSVKPKTMLRQGSDASMALVAAGQAEMVITLVSEIMQAQGIELVGPLPDEFQNYVRFSAAANTHTKNADAANALIKFLTNPEVAPTFKAKGIQPAK